MSDEAAKIVDDYMSVVKALTAEYPADPELGPQCFMCGRHADDGALLRLIAPGWGGLYCCDRCEAKDWDTDGLDEMGDVRTILGMAQ